jgi:cytochrome b6-f complex iron-sulfur subunit
MDHSITDETTDQTEHGQTSRRRVMLAGSATLLGAGALAACGGSSSGGTTSAGSAPASSGGSEGSSSGPTTLIALDKVPDGGAVAVSAAGLSLIVARPSGGDPVALSSVCPHQGCKVAPAAKNLLCPCHQSTFDVSGAKISGPAPTGLLTYPVEVKDGQIVLTSTTAGSPAV